jgi:hypothetical protein
MAPALATQLFHLHLNLAPDDGAEGKAVQRVFIDGPSD